MPTASRDEELKDITDALVREYQPEKIILFGSRAWGAPHEGSDIDICVLKETRQDPLDMMRDIHRVVFGRTRNGVDVVAYTPSRFTERLRMGDPFVKRIAGGGKVLYDAQRR